MPSPDCEVIDRTCAAISSSRNLATCNGPALNMGPGLIQCPRRCIERDTVVLDTTKVKAIYTAQRQLSVQSLDA